MKDTINILLECDLRQAEVAVLVKILQEEPRLLVKLVKQAIVREVEEAGTLILVPLTPSSLLDLCASSHISSSYVVPASIQYSHPLHYSYIHHVS